MHYQHIFEGSQSECLSNEPKIAQKCKASVCEGMQ